MKRLTVIICSFVFCLFNLNTLLGQSTGDGPIEMSVRVGQVYARDYEDVVFEAENSWKFWVRDNANLDGQDWRPSAGVCITYDISPSGFPFTSGFNGSVLMSHQFASSVPLYYQIRMDAWEDDCGSRCNFDGSSSNPFNACFYDPDDARCGPLQMGGDYAYRNNPPGVWTNDGWRYACGNAYGVRTESYWRYLYGTNFGNPIVLSSLGCNSTVTHYNNSSTYTNVLGNSAPDVFYQFTLTAAATINITTCSPQTNYDTWLRLYNSSQVQLASNDDMGSACSASTLHSQIITTLQPGTYYIVVEGFSSNSGLFLLTASTTANIANDVCAGAIVLPVACGSSCATTILGDLNECATNSGVSAPTCGNYSNGRDVWFRFTVGATGTVTVTTSSSGTGGITDPAMAIYSGSCGTLTQIACNDDAIGLFPQITVNNRTPGETLYVRVWRFGASQTGTFNICAYSPFLNTSAGSNTSICSGQSTQLQATGGGSYNWTPATGLSCTNCASPIANPTVTTTYTVNATDLVHGCNGSASVTVTVVPGVTANAGQDVTICQGGQTQLNATGGTNYSWSPIAGLSCTNCPNPIASPAVTTTYTVTVTTGTCSATDNVTVNVVPPPVVNITGNLSICEGENTTLTASTTGGSSQLTTTFAGGNNHRGNMFDVTILNNLTLLSFDVHPMAPTTVEVYFKTGTFNGFQNNPGAWTFLGSATLASVQPFGTPTPLPINFNLPLTAGQTYAFYVTSTNTSVSLNYTDGTAVGNIASQNSDLQIREGNGIEYPFSGTHFVPRIWNGTFKYSSSAFGGNYAWSTGATTSSITVSPTSNTSYSVTVSDGFGCSATASANVTVSPAPQLALPADTTLCLGNCVTLFNTLAASVLDQSNSSFVNTIPSTNFWQSFTPGASGDLSRIDVYLDQATTFNLEIYDGQGLGGTLLHSQTGNSAPGGGMASILLSAPVSVLSGNQYTFNLILTGVNNLFPRVDNTDPYSGGIMGQGGSTFPSFDVVFETFLSTYGNNPPYAFQWSNGATTPSIQVCPSTNTSYSVTMTNGINCSISGTVNVTVADSIGLLVSASNPDCFGATNGFINVVISGGTPPFSFQWSNGATTQNLSGLPAGTYNLTVSDAAGCENYRTVTLTQPGAINLVTTTSNYNGFGVSCNGASNGSIQLLVSGGNSPYSYLWSNGGTTQNLSNLVAGTYFITVTDQNGCSNSKSVILTQPLPININVNKSNYNGFNVSCPGATDGFAGLSVSGGSGGYQYAWSNGFTSSLQTGMVAGSYSVTVTDQNSCTATVTFDMTEPSPMDLSGTVVSNYNGFGVSCAGGNNGAIQVVVNGGASPYTYSWSNFGFGPNQTGLTVGNYSVTVTDLNGCTVTASYSLTAPPSIVLGTPVLSDYNGWGVSCFGANDGSASVNVSGGIAPYLFNWSNGNTNQNLTNAVAGNYALTVTDANGCTVSTSITLSSPPLLVVTATGTNVSCFGSNNGSVSLNVNGGTPPYSYAWNTGATTQSITNLGPGQYAGTVTDGNGCTASTSTTLSEPLALMLSITAPAGDTLPCHGQTTGSLNLTVSGGTVPYSYAWSNGAGTEDLTNLGAGTYTVTVTDFNGCTGTASYTLYQPAPLTGSTTVVNVSCFGGNDGSITVTPSGGTPPYSYSWGSNTLNNLTAGTYPVIITDSKGCVITLFATVSQPTALNVTIVNVSNVSCPGGSDGSAQVAISGGTPPYSRLWSNGATTSSISGLSAGTYGVTVTDAKGCIKTGSVNITQPNAIVAVGTLSRPSCNGLSNGSIELSVTGGTVPYGFVWSNGATTQNNLNIPAGSYSVTITDNNGCDAIFTYNLSEPDPLTLNIGSISPLCFGQSNGSLTANVSGGTTPYLYHWSNGATTATVGGLAAGNYSVTISDDNGCTVAGSILLTQPDSLSTTANLSDASCHSGNDGSIQLSVSGGTMPYSYNWSNGATTSTNTGLIAGTYSVTVSDANGCAKIYSYQIGEPAAISVSFVTTDAGCDTTSQGGSITITPSGGTPPYSYAWSNGATTQNISGLSAGSYTLTLTDANNCQHIVAIDILTITLSPAITHVSCNGLSDGSISITPGNGTPPYSILWSTGATTQSISGLLAGVYSVTVTDADGCSTEADFTVNQPAVLAALANPIHISCHGQIDGQVMLSVTGGTQPYIYSWSNSATTQNLNVLGAGVYSVTVTDANGCTTSSSTTIFEPLEIAIFPASTPVSCFGGSDGTLSVPVFGGTPPFTFIWSNGGSTALVSGVTAGTYGITVVDVNGCSVSGSVVVSQPSAFTFNETIANATCFGYADGNIQLSPAGGTAPYQYNWSNGATSAANTGLLAGSYSVTVQDGNFCTYTATYQVSEPTEIVWTDSVSHISCNGGNDGEIILFPSGGAGGYTFLWSTLDTTDTLSGLIAGNYSVTVTDQTGCFSVGSYTLTEPTAISASFSVTNLLCFGASTGAIIMTPSGGIPPYSYQWSNGADSKDLFGIPAGVYTVTITDDNGCTHSANTTVTQPAQLLVFTQGIDHVSCNGGSDGAIDLAAVGGTPPFTYLWSNGAISQDIFGLSTGVYTVTVTEGNGCTATLTVAVNEPSQLIAQITSTGNLICNAGNDGFITMTAAGGVQPYSYLWSNGATTQNNTGLPAGTFTVTVTDANGCTVSAGATITQPNPMILNLSATNVNCFNGADGSISLSISGGSPAYTFLWSNGSTLQNQTGLPAGSYSVTVTDANNCSQTASASITEPPLLTASASGTNLACFGNNSGAITLAVSGGVMPYSFNWSNGATTQNQTGLAAGTYSVTVLDANNCLVNASATLTQPTGLIASTVITTVSACHSGNNGSIDLTVSGGTPPYSYTWSHGPTTQNVSGLTPGTYTVSITDGNGCLLTETSQVTQDAAMLAVLVETNVSCFGANDGAIDLTVTGGTPPYTYSWTNGATTEDLSNLPPGTYSVVVVDSRGCLAIGSRTITQPTDILVNSSVTHVSCGGLADGEIQISVSGGVPPYSFQWITGATTQNVSNLSAGSYTVLVTDASGCTKFHTAQVTQPQTLAVGVQGQNPSCVGSGNGQATAIVSGGTSPYQYTWSNGGNTDNIQGLSAGTYSVTVTDFNGCTASGSVNINDPVLLSASAIATNISCFGEVNGSILLTVSGGATPYSYSWTNGATTQNLSGLGAGSYGVIVTDANGCVASATGTVNEPAALSVTANSSAVSCNGLSDGSINLTVSGGVSPYSYNWTNGATTQNIAGLGAGTYGVTVSDASGCTVSSTVGVTEPAVLELTVSTITGTCQTGSVVAIATGGNGGYTLMWSLSGNLGDTISGVAVGVYNATVTDQEGCEATANFTVASTDTLTYSAVIDPALCAGSSTGAIQLTATANSTISYLWSNGATTASISNLAAGAYSVSMSYGFGCSEVATYTISEPAALSVTGVVSNVICNGNNNGSVDITVTGGVMPYSYNWSNGKTDEDNFGLSFGTYVVTVTDANNCTTTGIYFVNEPTALNVTFTQLNASCHNSSDANILVNVTGAQPPYSFAWSTGSTNQNLTGVAAGSYDLTVTDNAGCFEELTFNITHPAPIVIIETVNHPTCGGGTNGSISLQISGGTAPYNYAWNNGSTTASVSGLAEGSYTVTVTDANNCSETETWQLSAPNAIQVSLSVSNVSVYGGNDGSIDATVTGGNAPLSYNWSNGQTSANISGLIAGNYTITVTDQAGCSVVSSATVTQPAMPCDGVDSLWTPLIQTASARLQWTPSPNAYYYMIRGRWIGSPNWVYVPVGPGQPNFKDVFGLYNATTYLWQIKAYCSANDTIGSVWSSIDTFTTICDRPDSLWTNPITTNAARLNWTTVPGAAGYEIRGGKLGAPNVVVLQVSGGGTSFKDVFGLTPNTGYWWRVRAVCNLTGTLKTVNTERDTFFTNPGAKLVGLKDPFDPNGQPALSLYPNPAQNEIFLQFDQELKTAQYEVVIFDLKGKATNFTRIEDTEAGQIRLDVSGLPAGVYHVTVTGPEGRFIEKLVITR